MENNAKNKVTSGLIWTYLERFSAQIVSLVVSVILARILLPDAYGVIAIVQIFITIANVFMSDGLGNALIQKKDCDSLDCSTVMYFSIGYSLILYAAIFIAAPFIAEFYETPLASGALRVMALRLPIAGINTVQKAIVSRNMQFKKFFFATLGGTVVSAVVGITMALLGCGVWALVAQYLTNSVIDTVWLSFTIDWRPRLEFSWKRMKGLFGYGWKLLATSLLTTLYGESRSIIIGKKYHTTDLAFVKKGEQFPSLLAVNINTSITSVLFPTLALCQNDHERLKQITRRSVRISSFLLSPILVGLAAVSTEAIAIVLTDKWIDCVPYMQVYCLIYLLQPIQTAGLQCMKALGRSDLNLKLQVVKSIFGILIVLITVFCFDSVFLIVLAALVAEVFATIVNFPVNKKLIGYTFGEQLCDMGVPLAISGIMFAAVYAVNYLALSYVISLAVKVIVGAAVYIVLSVFLQRDSLRYSFTIIKDLVSKKRG